MDASRLGLAAALGGVVVAPLLTLHPIEAHLHDAGEALLPAPLHAATIIVLLALVIASFVPLLLALAMAARCLRHGSALRLVNASTRGEVSEGGVACTLVDMPGVQFFTAGLFRPRVYATTGARTQLPTEVFRAAILHERAHQRRHDVLWRIALAALEAALHPLPAGRRLAANIALEWELAADREAIHAGAGREHLFEALVAASILPPPGAGVALSSVGTMQRLAVLATGETLPRRDPLGHVGGYLAALALAPLTVHLAFWSGAVCL